MRSKKESSLDTKSSLVDADKFRILNSADNDDSEAISYVDLKTQIITDIIPSSLVSSHDPAGSYIILDDDGYTHIIDSATGTITLPTLADNYDRIITIVRDVADSSTALIIDSEGAETIAGKELQHLYGRYGSITIMASEDAGEWVFVGTPFDPYIVSFYTASGYTIPTPAKTTWINIPSHSITLPTGKWKIGYEENIRMGYANPTSDYLIFQAALSTTTTGSTDAELLVTCQIKFLEAFDRVVEKDGYIVEVSSSTPYYFNVWGNWNGTISFFNIGVGGRIYAERVF